MALALRLRRAAVCAAADLLRSTTPTFAASSQKEYFMAPSPLLLRRSAPVTSQSMAFRSSAVLSRFDRGAGRAEEKLDPNEILFEGCDYNHWLITMDFPDPKPPADEMVRTYEETAAKIFGSLEEAKKRIYACSTTTYVGFQVVCTEEVSEKFKEIPGVVFVLPDSYLYPDTKEYGGDKYENGVITPRPPPVQYTRRPPRQNRNNSGGGGNWNDYRPRERYQDQSPGPMQSDRTNYSRQDYPPQQPPNQEGRGFGQPTQDGRSFGQPGQNGRGFGQPGQDGQGYGPPGQGGRGYYGDYQQGFGERGQGNFRQQEQRNFTQGPGGRWPSDASGPPQGGGFAPGRMRNDYQQGFGDGGQGNIGQQERRNFPQGPNGGWTSDASGRGGNIQEAPFPSGDGSRYGQER